MTTPGSMNYPPQPPEYPGQSPEQRLQSARSWAERAEPSTPALRASTAQMTERLQTVLEAAERAAEAIRYDAEEQARRHLAGAQQRADGLTAERVRLISQLTDELIGHASVVRHHSAQMVGALEQAITAVSGRLDEVKGGRALTLDPSSQGSIGGGQPAEGTTFRYGPGSAGGTPRQPQADVVAEASARPAPGPPPSPPPAAALLRATQLAVSGASRDSIAEALRTEFGIDPTPVLAQVLG